MVTLIVNHCFYSLVSDWNCILIRFLISLRVKYVNFSRKSLFRKYKISLKYNNKSTREK